MCDYNKISLVHNIRILKGHEKEVRTLHKVGFTRIHTKPTICKLMNTTYEEKHLLNNERMPLT